jgi:hypothetical protein
MQKYKLAKANLENGLNTSFSIGYRTEKRSYGEYQGQQVRFLEKIDLREISQVVFPCNELATATSIKSEKDLNVREIENCLRDAGLSKAQALKHSSLIKSDLCDAEETDEKGEVVEEEVVENGQVDETEATEETQVDEVVQEEQKDEIVNDDDLVEELKQALTILNLKQTMENF